MSKTKKITLSALIVALCVVFLVMGASFELFDLSVCAFASLLVAFVYIEIGSPYTFLVWLSSSLLAFLLFPASFIWAEFFLIFGIYPILKGYIERLLHKLWWPLKLIYANVAIVILILSCKLITGLPFFEVENRILIGAIYLVLNVAFVLYDFFLTVLIHYYMKKLRARFKSFLK